MRFKLTKTTVFLTIIFLLAILLRILVATHVVIGSDELVYSSIPINILSAERVSTAYQSHLYFYLLDASYKLFGGVTPLSTRFPSVLFGSFAVFVVFLLGHHLFGRTEGLIAAFLFAVSGYALRYNVETDMPAFFLAALSVLFFLYGLRDARPLWFYLSTLFLVLAVSVKNILLLFVPIYVLIFILYDHRFHRFFISALSRRFSIQKRFVLMFVFSAIISLIILSPIFVYNFLLYKDRDVTDFYFSTVIGLGKAAYSGLENNPWSFSTLKKVLYKKIDQFFRYDPVIFIFGFIGAFFSFRRRKIETMLLLFTLIFLFMYLGGVTGSPSHYLWVPLVLSVFASPALLSFHDRVLSSFHFRYFLTLFFVVLLSLTIFLSWDVLTLKNSVLSLREYVSENIPKDAIVVLDPRIYSGIFAWAFHDVHYLDGTLFPQFSALLEQASSAPKTRMPIYYIECGKGTECIWGKEDYQRIYDSAEELTTFFKARTKEVARVTGEAIKQGDRHTFIVYAGSLEAPSEVYELIDRSHIFWFYPVGWKYTDQLPDGYITRGLWYTFDRFGLIISYLNLILAVLSLPFTLFVIARRDSLFGGDVHG